MSTIVLFPWGKKGGRLWRPCWELRRASTNELSGYKNLIPRDAMPYNAPSTPRYKPQGPFCGPSHDPPSAPDTRTFSIPAPSGGYRLTKDRISAPGAWD